MMVRVVFWVLVAAFALGSLRGILMGVMYNPIYFGFAFIPGIMTILLLWAGNRSGWK